MYGMPGNGKYAEYQSDTDQVDSQKVISESVGGSTTPAAVVSALQGMSPTQRIKAQATTLVPLVAVLAAEIVLVGTTSRTVMWSVKIPAGTTRGGQVIRIRPIWQFTGSTNSKTMEVLMGPEPIGNRVLFTKAITAAGTIGMAPICDVVVKSAGLLGLVNNNNWDNSMARPSSGSGEASINPDIDNVIQFTGTMASASEEIRLQQAVVEILGG